jgi:uncharacterized protein
MPLAIKQDQARFRDIVRGRIKANLRQYVQQGELLGRQGKRAISIPVPSIELPRFRFGEKQQGGVGQGPGQPGDPLSGQDAEPGGQAGQGEGQHLLEVDVSLDELADLLGEALALPRLEPRGHDRLVTTRIKYTGVAPSGPESLRHFRRTYKQALRRQISSGTYDPRRPVIIPIREDRRYRTWAPVPVPQSNAVVIYMMDVSGSMGEEQKEVVRLESFWIDTWLRRHYPGLVTRYLVHDAAAHEVDRETFFHSRESGGTMISSAYQLALQIIEADYPTSSWNVYPFHFSDGDNWSADDTRVCLELLRDRLLPASNLFCYGQVQSPYGSGQFIRDLRAGLGPREDLALAEIADRDGILDSIKAFLGTGR